MDNHFIIIFCSLIIIIVLLHKRNNKYYNEQQRIYYKYSKDKFIESFYNRYMLPSINNHNFNNIKSESDFLKKNSPYKVSILSSPGDKKISINSINGLKIGDDIIINPNKKNTENKKIIGIGNGILFLNNKLNYKHQPNEYIINKSNNLIQYNQQENELEEEDNRYATIRNHKINFIPQENTWGNF